MCFSGLAIHACALLAACELTGEEGEGKEGELGEHC